MVEQTKEGDQQVDEEQGSLGPEMAGKMASDPPDITDDPNQPTGTAMAGGERPCSRNHHARTPGVRIKEMSLLSPLAIVIWPCM